VAQQFREITSYFAAFIASRSYGSSTWDRPVPGLAAKPIIDIDVVVATKPRCRWFYA